MEIAELKICSNGNNELAEWAQQPGRYDRVELARWRTESKQRLSALNNRAGSEGRNKADSRQETWGRTRGLQGDKKEWVESVWVAAKKLLVWVDGKHLSDAEWVCNPKKFASPPSSVLVPPERSPVEAVLEEAWIQSQEEMTAKNCQLWAQLLELSSQNDRNRQTFSEGNRRTGKKRTNLYESRQWNAP